MKRFTFQYGVLGVMLSLAMACGGGTTESQEDESMMSGEGAMESAGEAMGEAVESTGEAMGEAMESTGEAMEDATMQFQSDVSAKLTTIQKGIDNLKAQAGEYGDDAVAQANQVLGPLTEQSRAIQQDLEGLQEESGESMEQMRAGIEAAVAELERAYQDARSKLQQ